MPYVEALRTFKGRYGHVNRGDKFNCEDGYFKALKKNGLVQLAKPEHDGAEPGPTRDRNIPQAPGRSGKEQAGGDQGNPPATDLDPTQTGGQALTSSSLQVDRASRKRTLPLSAPGARKGTPTPRKPKGKSPDA